MKRSVHTWVVRTIKRHPNCKVPIFAIYTLFLIIYYLCKAFIDNRYRLAVVMGSVLIFFTSTSFSYENKSELRPVEHETNEQEEVEDEIEKGNVFEQVEESEKIGADELLLDETELTEETMDESMSRSDWNLILINKQHPIPTDYEFTLGSIRGSMRCDERILPSLLAMLRAAKADGVNLVICSPYRDMNRQEALFNRKITGYMKKGMSYLDAYKTTAQAVTVPGASEHQIGLALDIVCDRYAMLNEGFGETEAGKWLASKSCKYGFILRYPKGKEEITGIEYEPWHFRYVGTPAAMEMTRNNQTLEEFVESLPYE